MGGVWSRSLESLLCELWGNFGGILEHGSIHLSARAVAERYFFGKFIPEVPSKSGSGRVGRTKTVPDFRVKCGLETIEIQTEKCDSVTTLEAQTTSVRNLLSGQSTVIN